jgi:hypothetical protein
LNVASNSLCRTCTLHPPIRCDYATTWTGRRYHQPLRKFFGAIGSSGYSRCRAQLLRSP